MLLESKTLYDGRRSLLDYIERAGGFADNANRAGVVVTYPNGERRTVSRVFGFRHLPPVEPGSTIFVPTLTPSQMEGTNWGAIISQTTAVMTAFATLYLALNR